MTDLELACPNCAVINHAHDGADPDQRPTDGAVAICFSCAGIGIFVGNPPTEIRRPTEAELEAILADAGVAAAVDAVQHATTPAKALDRWRLR